MAGINVGVLASGRGSNFEALVRATRKEAIDADIRLLIANVPGAPALDRAAALDVPALTVDHRQFRTRREFEQAVTAELDRHDIRLVCLAGFMRILSPWFTARWPNKVMNIHPSLLPAFAGLQGTRVHEAVIESGARVTGCTVHFVSDDLDGGPIIIQRAIAVRDDDTPESLSLRVLVEEHHAYPEAVKLYCDQKLEVSGRRVRRLE